MNDANATAILQLVHDYCAAISHGDSDAFRVLWRGSEDDTLISITTDYHGIDAIVDGFLPRLHELYASIELIEDETPSIRPLTEDTAVVVFRYHTECVRAETGEPYGISGLETQLMLRTSAGWRLAHIHYSK